MGTHTRRAGYILHIVDFRDGLFSGTIFEKLMYRRHGTLTVGADRAWRPQAPKMSHGIELSTSVACIKGEIAAATVCNTSTIGYLDIGAFAPTIWAP